MCIYVCSIKDGERGERSESEQSDLKSERQSERRSDTENGMSDTMKERNCDRDRKMMLCTPSIFCEAALSGTSESSVSAQKVS